MTAITSTAITSTAPRQTALPVLEKIYFPKNMDLLRSSGNHWVPEIPAAKDSIELSAGGAAAAAAAPVSLFEDKTLWPTREGFSAAGLMRGAIDPADQFFSGGRAFGDVAKAARETLDAKAAAIKAMTGDGLIRTPSVLRAEYKANPQLNATRMEQILQTTDQISLMGDFDRRALWAIITNEGKLFSENEVEMANSMRYMQNTINEGYDPREFDGSWGAAVGDATWNNIIVPSAKNLANYLMKLEGEEAVHPLTKSLLAQADDMITKDSQFTLNDIMGLSEEDAFNAMVAASDPNRTKEDHDKLIASMTAALESLKATRENQEAFTAEQTEAAEKAKGWKSTLESNLTYFQQRAAYEAKDKSVISWKPPVTEPGTLVNLAA